MESWAGGSLARETIALFEKTANVGLLMGLELHRLVEGILLRIPWLYAALLELAGRGNANKLLFLRVISPGDVVVDVGAHLGCYSLLFVRLAGRLGSVHAFEPVPDTFQELSRALRRWESRGRIRLNKLAVGNTVGPTTIFIPASDLAQSSLRTQEGGSWRSASTVAAVTCECTTIDAYASANQLKRVDAIKCDVEGAELEALCGGEAVLRRHTPLLHLEVSRQWSSAFGYSPQILIEYLQALGYESFLVVDKGARGELRLSPLPEVWPETGTVDVLCLHRIRKHQAILALLAARGCMQPLPCQERATAMSSNTC